MRASSAFSLLLAATPLASLAAQSVAPGQRVRITYIRPADSVTVRAVGKLVSWDTTVVLATDTKRGAPVQLTRVPAASVALVNVTVRKESRPMRGALIGVIAGGTAGALLGLALHEDCTPSRTLPGEVSFFSGCVFTLAPEESMGAGAILFGAVGGIAGLIVGALTKADRWDVVPPPYVGLRIVPTAQGGAALSLALAW